MTSLLEILLMLLSEMLFMLSLDCELAQHHCTLLKCCCQGSPRTEDFLCPSPRYTTDVVKGSKLP